MMRSTRIAAVYLAVVFLAGTVFGVVADRLYQRTASAGPPSRPNPKDFRVRYLDRLQKDLGLSPEQLSQVTTILEETDQRFRQVREKTAPEFESIRNDQRQRISALLSPEQRPKYDGILEQHRREREKRRR